MSGSPAAHPLLVVGGGIAGITAALEAAEAGRKVVLVEREPYVGGRITRTHQYFPKMCPPSCGMEINTRRLEHNANVHVWVDTEVTGANRTDTGWQVTVRHKPAYVNERCTACGACSQVCPVSLPDPFNLGLNQVKAIRLAHGNAWPRRFILDRHACPDGCRACVDACTYNAIDLTAQAREESLEVGAVVIATGWSPYPLEKLPELGGGLEVDVIANVHMERLAAPGGPTDGKILRPSDGTPPKRVAFVQCAGSRDVNHLPYCSAVCCLASLKQAIYVKEQLPDADVAIYYIDRRAPGRNEDVLTRVAAMEGVRLVKGKVGKIARTNGVLTLKVEDVDRGVLAEAEADLVVLATGMVSNLKGNAPPFAVVLDEDGFGLSSHDLVLSVAGVAHRPEDVAASVREATGAAARAIAATGRRV